MGWRSLLPDYFIKKLNNYIGSFFLLLLMISILGITGYLISGIPGIVVSVLFSFIFFFINPKVSPVLILKMYNAKELGDEEASGLYRILNNLAENASVNVVPRIYYIPSKIMNAFSLGNKKFSVIALTDGILRNLNWKEITGVLAHEISHIQHGDLSILSLADSLTRFTHLFSILGQLLLILYFPLYFIADIHISIILIIVLLAGPVLSVIIQMALSRTREFEADLNAVKLTGDPVGLASALQKIENSSFAFWNIFFMFGRNFPGPSFLRTHPGTEKRIKKLLDYSIENNLDNIHFYEDKIIPDHYTSATKKPRWKITGLWH